MRTEASLEQWKVLYEAATEIGAVKPWERFGDMDVIAVRNGNEEDTVFFCILGQGGDCYGIAVYEGYEAFNTFLMLTVQESMNLSPEYAMFHQKNLTCYWGNREELSEKQRKVIKELGYKYRGRNQWLYFMSFEPGYYPYNLDADEVVRMSGHLQDLRLALSCYYDNDVEVDFSTGHMFLLTYGDDKKSWQFGEAELPFTSFQYGDLFITDEEFLQELGQAPKNDMILEADVAVMMASVTDKKYDRPANPVLSLIGDAASGAVFSFEMSGPFDDPLAALAEKLIDLIFKVGAPKEVRVSNVIIEAGLAQICDTCGIKLRRVKCLPGLANFMEEMNSRMC